LFAEERQRLLKDAAERQTLFAGIRRLRRTMVAAEHRKSKGGDARAGSTMAPEDNE
jgi:hypothetical protein